MYPLSKQWSITDNKISRWGKWALEAPSQGLGPTVSIVASSSDYLLPIRRSHTTTSSQKGTIEITNPANNSKICIIDLYLILFGVESTFSPF